VTLKFPTIPIGKYGTLIPHGIDLISAAFDLAKRARDGSLTWETAKADADKAWDDFWQIVVAIEAH
jgi:hypothetical protein